MKRADKNSVSPSDTVAEITALSEENTALRARIAELEGGYEEAGKKLSLERIVLRTLVETCPFRIYAKDRESRFIFGNSELARAVGVESDNFLGKTDFDLFPESLAALYFADEQALLASGQSLIAKEEPTIDPKTGDRWWILTSKVPLRDQDGTIIGLVGVGFNVTERKQLEQELLRSNNELTELNRNLLETREQLIQSEKLAALGALVAGIAHELNTPIGNSLMLASMLQENCSALTADMVNGLKRSQLESFMDKTQEGAEMLMRSLHRAADLVASFKQVAVDRTSAQRRRFNLREMVAEVVLTLGPGLRKTSHRLAFEIPAEIGMDSYPGPLGQVLTNLINNAVLHAFDDRQNGKINIAADQPDQDHVRITVRDDGVGIVAANLARVFDPFFTTKMGRGGSGLGLNIAYNLVRGILGGQIHAASELGQGACFTLALPLVAPDLNEQQQLVPLASYANQVPLNPDTL